MTNFLSFILLIILIVAIVVVAPFIAKHLHIKVNLFIVCGYLTLLVAFSIISLLLPGGALIKAGKGVQPAGIGYTGDLNIFYKRISAGNFDAPSGYIKAVKSFTPNGKTIFLKNSISTFVIYVGTKGIDAPDNHNGKIDVYYYGGAYVSFNGTNLTPKVQTPLISYDGKTLAIKNVGQITLNYYSFDDRYTARQFLSQSNDDGDSISSNCIEQVVVLLPRGVTISGGDYCKFSDLKS